MMQLELKTPREAIIYELGKAEGLKEGFNLAIQQWQRSTVASLSVTVTEKTNETT